ncbi:flavin-containing monooxygenase [Candidatus Entotheonella palauensis]|uniref:flavin-containing monooxygenase n=1 Tax=Candidatus Entotheonella palauensis TaxID=93172 RepID=UPI0021193C98|nr:FAD-dependent oxidoreductase [Candidatus Entotheonella palauensis]
MDTAEQQLLEKGVIQSEQALVAQWLGQFDIALQGANPSSLASLFASDGHWRDLLAFTWSITPRQGAETIAALMVASQPATRARRFAIAEGRTPPRRVQRAGIDVIEAIFQFETEVGRGFGVLRLLASEPAKAFQMMTSLHELKGFEETIGNRCPTGEAFSRNFGGANWKEQREAIQVYADREPVVLIVGGGQAGLSLAATLGRIGVDTLVVDKFPRIGDCWRRRYHSLALHNDTKLNHLPYMPFPSSWPTYLPKDMVADWFETYAWAMEINFWTSTEFVRGEYDDAAGIWNAMVRRADGSERTLHPRHLVFANGLVGSPNIPELPGLKDFKGDMMHTAVFTNGANWRGKKALVIGTGTSGHDVAQDLHANGCDTTIVQRGATMVLSIDPSAKLTYGIHNGIPIEDGDLLSSTNTKPVVKKTLQGITKRMLDDDREIIDGLIARGFKFTDGEDGAGHQWMVRTRYGGYYLDAGCSQLIIDGEIGLLQYNQIERFVANGALLKDGSVKPADLIVLATGFLPQEVVIRKLLGDTVAKKVGQIWGFDADGEMSNMWKRTAQRGLWFVGGGFNNCRINSRYVALQIKAIEEGLLPA